MRFIHTADWQLGLKLRYIDPERAAHLRLMRFQTVRKIAKLAVEHKAALQSWGSADTPFVRLVVEASGHEYEIQKRFLKGGSALLTGGGSTLRDEEAEEVLRQMTRAKPSGSRGISDADMGIWPILMIRQGESIQAPSIAVNEDGLAQLHERVSAEIGVAAVSPASQKLMELARTEYERYYTVTGQENKVLRDVRKNCSDLQAELDKAQASYERQARLAGMLAVAQTELTDLEQRQAGLVAEADETEKRVEKATQAANALSAAKNKFESRRNARNEAHSALQRRQELAAVVHRLTDEAAQIRERRQRKARRRSAPAVAIRSAEPWGKLQTGAC